jgi:hypothetical protein
MKQLPSLPYLGKCRRDLFCYIFLMVEVVEMEVVEVVEMEEVEGSKERTSVNHTQFHRYQMKWRRSEKRNFL